MRELLAAFLGVRHFIYFLEGVAFTIYTDHSALIPTATNSKPREIHTEWIHLNYFSVHTIMVSYPWTREHYSRCLIQINSSRG